MSLSAAMAVRAPSAKFRNILQLGAAVARCHSRSVAAIDSTPPYRIVIVLGLLVLLVPSLCPAQILIEPRVGFHGVFQLGRPFPLEIELTNTGRVAEGILEVRVWKGAVSKAGVPLPLYYRKEIFLAAQSKKSVQFTVDPDFLSRPLTITFTSPGDSVSRELDLRRYFSPAPVILLVSEGNTLPAITLGSSSQSRLVALSLAELPSDSRALLGVSHLILYDLSLRELSRNQSLALENWVIAGGRMVILASINQALYQEATLSRFLPVRVTGQRQIPALALVKAGGGVAPPVADVWALTSNVLAGQVVADAQGTPLIVEANRGKGKITYVAFDVGRPPLSQWHGLAKFFENLLAPAVGGDTLPRTQWDDAVFAQLIQSPSLISTYVPAGAFFLALVGYLIGVGFFATFAQRKQASLRTAAWCLLAFISVSASAGYFFFNRGGNIPDGVLLSATVLETSTDGYVEAQANLALFSTQIRQYNLQVARGWLDLTPATARAREQATVVYQDGAGASRFELPLREWDYRLYKARFVEHFPVRVEFEQQGDKLVVKINNQSGKDLTECWLAVPGRRYPLGDIPRGARWVKEFSLAPVDAKDETSANRGERVDLREVSFKDKTRDILFHSAFFPRESGAELWSGSAVVFFGWVKDSQRRFEVDDPRIRETDYTLFRAVMPLAGAEDT
jgi:hypothetical protein